MVCLCGSKGKDSTGNGTCPTSGLSQKRAQANVRSADAEPWPGRQFRRSCKRNEAHWKRRRRHNSGFRLRPFKGEYNMSITQYKPQQQTLSIRVSESLREFLELSRHVIANGRGDASVDIRRRKNPARVSEGRTDWIFGWSRRTAAITNFFARADPTINGSSSNCCPGQSGSFSAQYIQVACEELSGTTRLPSPDFFIALLKHCWPCALSGPTAAEALDRVHLGNLGVPGRYSLQRAPIRPRTSAARRCRSDSKPAARSSLAEGGCLAGRNLYVALRDEVLSGYGRAEFKISSTSGHTILVRGPRTLDRAETDKREVAAHSEMRRVEAASCVFTPDDTIWYTARPAVSALG